MLAPRIEEERRLSAHKVLPARMDYFLSCDKLAALGSSYSTRLCTTTLSTKITLWHCLRAKSDLIFVSVFTFRCIDICTFVEQITLSTVTRFSHVQLILSTMQLLNFSPILALFSFISSTSAQAPAQATLISNTLPACAQSCPTLIQAQSACVPPPLGAAAVTDQRMFS